MAIELLRNDAALQYEAIEDGHLLGRIEYRIDEDTITITHTVTQPEHRGRGIADQLTRFAVDDIRALGLSIVPQCPFTQAWFDAHPDETDLLAVV